MDPLDRAQVLLLCDLCQRAALQNHCELCQINICKACVGEHLSDSSQRHKVVPYKQRKSETYSQPKCQSHTENLCAFYCETCDIPICFTCISSNEHYEHKCTDFLKKLRAKKKDLQRDLEEIEERIYPAYEEILLDLNFEKVSNYEHYEELTAAVTKQEEDLHREIILIVNKRKSEIDVMKKRHMDILSKQEKEIKRITSEVKKSLFDLKKILDSNDIFLTLAYESRNAEFLRFPQKVNVSFPNFTPPPISTEQLNQMFGLLYKPELISSVNTGFELTLNSVTCLSDEEIWTCGEDRIMKLYNLQGKLLKSIQTKSGNYPGDISVTKGGHLVYIDRDTRTVNLVNNKLIHEFIRLRGWKPSNICSTSTGDLLVIMVGDGIQSKVVRYSGFTEKQTIQFDSKGDALYSCNDIKYICENRNLDICVSDYEAKAIVVVNQGGKLRFRYTGHPSTTNGSFRPYGITRDSHCQILTSDNDNNCIHILDQDGQFLCYIDNCDLKCPWGLCVDTRDNLFVAEHLSGFVKKIKYM